MRFSRSFQIIVISIALLLGIICGRQGINMPVWPFVLLAFILIILKPKYLWLGLAIFLGGIGIARGFEYWHQTQDLKALIGQTVTITATVADDPATSPKKVISFTIDHIVWKGKHLEGSMPVYTYPVRVQRGHVIQLTGKIKHGFGKYTAEFSYPKIIVLDTHQSKLEQLRGQFFAGMRTALPEPSASFGLGLLVGIRALIPKDLQATLALVGLSHLVAVSGYNLTIIVRGVERLLLRFGRGVALVISLWVIAGFLSVTGASSSVVRAAVISVLVLLATFYGRQFKPFVLLLLAASATATANPAYLTDLGWLLSFLAFYGILVLAPAIWQRFGEPKSILFKLFIESLCAQLMTLPLILFVFGQLSIVAPLSNVIILPLVPIAMAVCLAAGLAGMIIPAWCGWFAWPAQLLISLILNIINAFAGISWAGKTLYFNASTMIISYVILGLLTVAMIKGKRSESQKLLLPNEIQKVRFIA